MRLRLKGAPEPPEPIEEDLHYDQFWRPNERPELDPKTFRPLKVQPDKTEEYKKMTTEEKTKLREERAAVRKAYKDAHESAASDDEEGLWKEGTPTT